MGSILYFFFYIHILWPFSKWCPFIFFSLFDTKMKRKYFGFFTSFKIFNRYIWFSSPISGIKSKWEKIASWRKRDMRFDSSAMSLVFVHKYLRADHDTKIPQIGWFFVPTLSSQKVVYVYVVCKDIFWNLMQLQEVQWFFMVNSISKMSAWPHKHKKSAFGKKNLC